jgi:GT2 family glycosyltransferase
MPTADRPRWVPQAIRYFLRQDYPNRELVIVDDGEQSIEHLVPADPRIRFHRIPSGLTLGGKRNVCVEASRGDLILHWDDDDWFAPHRIRTQVGALLRANAEICGQPRMLFHELATGRTWLYALPAHEPLWLAGGSLLYTKEFWRRGPFPDLQMGSDTAFVSMQSLDRAATIEDCELYVAMIHPDNTSPKCIQSNWQPWPHDLRAVLGEDAAFYDIAPIPSAVPPRVDILVPTFGQEEFTIRCFDTLRAHTNSYRLIWLDDGSSSASRAAVAEVFALHRDRRAVAFDQNRGFIQTVNDGLREESKAEYVVLLNNDTEVTHGWLDRLLRVLDANPSLAAAGPMTSSRDAWQGWPNFFAAGRMRDLSPGEIARSLADEFGDRFIRVPMLAFFCTALRRRVFTEAGLLDERFGIGFGDDDDYCHRLLAAGYELAFVPGAYVVHHHRTTFRARFSDAEITVMQNANLEEFRRKHGIG